MAQPALSLANEARALTIAIKELLVSKDPWDREVEFQRKKLRKVYLTLLLVHPYERESQLENHLWMQTTYNFISPYKQLIADLEKQLEARQPVKHTKDGQGVVAQRKIINRFRQFLAEEEKFYLQLVSRCHRTFDLSEVHQVLVTLNIVPDIGPEDDTHDVLSSHHSHHQFPPEEATQTHLGSQQRIDCLMLVAELLIYLGDIARYREQYNESGGRPKAGQDGGPPKKSGRNKKGGPEIAKARNYERAHRFYEQARALVPTNGHAFHQMAILASYQRDTFASLVYYYRAICTPTPFEVAFDNVRSTLEKIASNWKAVVKEDRVDPTHLNSSSEYPIRVKLHIFHTHLVSLHALWRLGSEQTDSISPNLAEDVAAMFTSLISQQILLEEQVYKSIVLTQAALYKHKMIREKNRNRTHNLSAQDVPIIEERMLSHLLAFHSVLLREGISQLPGPSQSRNSGNTQMLAQKITANLRRTLPALRIASKWLRANLKYIVGRKDTFLPEFWGLFAQFNRSLAKAFPLSSLPKARIRHEEDIDLNGFLPLKKLLEVDQGITPSELNHPNEEQLIRIADLLKDARILAQEVRSTQASPRSVMPTHLKRISPLEISGGYIAVKTSNAKASPPRQHKTRSPVAIDPSSSSPDQDVLQKDMEMERMVDNLELSDDDDQIVYMKNQASPISSPPNPNLQAQGSSLTPQRGVSRPLPLRSPTTPTKQTQPIQSQTASDLLNSFMVNPSRSPPYQQRPMSSVLPELLPPILPSLSSLASHDDFTSSKHPISLPPPTQIPQEAWPVTPPGGRAHRSPYPPISNPAHQIFTPLAPATGFSPYTSSHANPLSIQTSDHYLLNRVTSPVRQQQQPAYPQTHQAIPLAQIKDPFGPPFLHE